jgi:hypothetical protein
MSAAHEADLSAEMKSEHARRQNSLPAEMFLMSSIINSSTLRTITEI